MAKENKKAVKKQDSREQKFLINGDGFSNL